MAKTNDFTKSMQDMMGAFQMDNPAFKDMFKTQTEMSEKLVKVALEAAEKSTDITSKWAKETFSKVGSLAATKEQPGDYAKAMSDFAAAAAEMAAENMAAFAEVAKKVQSETVELMLSAGKEMQADATAAVKKATDDMTSTVKKAAAAK